VTAGRYGCRINKTEKSRRTLMKQLLVLLSSVLLLTGCEEELNLSNEKEDDSTAEQIARILAENDKAGIYVGGSAADSKLDTVGAPVIIDGSITNVAVNTAAAEAK
jgi:uncharacterized lipoprotein YajG